MRVRRFGSACGQRLAVIGEHRWRRLALLLALAWLLAVLARLFWLLLPAPAAAEHAAPTASAPVAAPSAGVDIDALAGWQLFGAAGEAAGQPAAVADGIESRAADSALDLHLQGVMSSVDGKLARAVILGQGRQQQFAIGEALPTAGRVTLARVLPDRVIIDNNGRYETLWLYHPDGAPVPPQPAVLPEADTDSRPAVSTAASSLAEAVQVAAVQESGRLIGYRVSPGADSALFRQLGFEAGDVVTAVNGNDLADPQQALALYNTIRSATEARFSVRRGDAELTLDVALPAP